ncbi:Uncharacterized protein Rs2_14509 [Raphanus sativus]|nr:Uncharacterized protein Rs2_14509 [Raphanus sativus]
MEQTAAAIVAASSNQPPALPQLKLSDSNPVTPPPLNEFLLQNWLFQDPTDCYTPPARRKKDDTLDVIPNEAPLYVPTVAPIIEGEKAKLKSIVISPTTTNEIGEEVPQTETVQPEEEETLMEFQNKVKSNLRKPTKQKSPRVSPNILRGASSKKRKLSQIQHSPGRGLSSPENASTKKKSVNKRARGEVGGPSHADKNPPIHLIPAISRKNPDFRRLPHQAP